MDNITASQAKQRLAELLEISKKEADQVLWAFEELCREAVAHGQSITFPGVGKLVCNVQASRKARNPATGETFMAPAKVAVKFRVAAPLKSAAPSLSGKRGKALLAEAEAAQAKRDKARRKRERAAAKEETPIKKSSKIKNKKKNRAKARI